MGIVTVTKNGHTRKFEINVPVVEPEPVEENTETEDYDKEYLEGLDFAALKEIANKEFGVTGRSKGGLIEDILVAQGDDLEVDDESDNEVQ